MVPRLKKETPKTILSASTPTGDLTLGNYAGALRNWERMQEKSECYYMLADLHALTTPQDPKKFHKKVLSFLAQYLACGLDTEKSVIFVQSHVPEHSQLCWILNCITPMGALNRMTQFKDKSKKTKEIENGLYSYPVLMAADILLYQADMVPVGEDQKQHLEMTRDLALRFNKRYGETFKIPKPYIHSQGGRIMSLQDPHKKMSKSDENPKNFISILDPPNQILKKIKSAVTDSDPKAQVIYDKVHKKALANLMDIYSLLSGESTNQIETTYQGKMYGHFKKDLAEIICQTLKPVQFTYNKLMDDTAFLLEVMEKQAHKAQKKAHATLVKVHQALGLWAP